MTRLVNNKYSTVKPLVQQQENKNLLLPIAGLVMFFVIWELGVRLSNTLVIPPPSSIPAAIISEFKNGMLLRMMFLSLRHYVLGVFSGIVLGVTVGILLAVYASGYTAVKWIIRTVRPIPPLAWIPFAIIWFGISEVAASFIIAIGVFWINFFAAYGAVRSVDPDLMEVAVIYAHNNFFDRLFRVIIPAAANGIMNGIRASLGQGWMTVIASELFGIAGIGQRMMEASGLLAIEVVAVYMIAISCLYGLTDVCFVFIRKVIMSWEQT